MVHSLSICFRLFQKPISHLMLELFSNKFLNLLKFLKRCLLILIEECLQLLSLTCLQASSYWDTINCNHQIIFCHLPPFEFYQLFLYQFLYPLVILPLRTYAGEFQLEAHRTSCLFQDLQVYLEVASLSWKNQGLCLLLLHYVVIISVIAQWHRIQPFLWMILISTRSYSRNLQNLKQKEHPERL